MRALIFALTPGDRVIYSARLHSRVIDRVGAVRTFVRYGDGKSRGRSRRPGNEKAAPEAPCLADHPVSRGSVFREDAGGAPTC